MEKNFYKGGKKMNYQVRHTSFFMEFIHNFNSLNAVVDFVKGSSFQFVKEYEIFAFSNLFKDLEIDSLKFCSNGNWNLKTLIMAANIELSEIIKDYDEYEYRNNFDKDQFFKLCEKLNITGMLELIDFVITDNFESFENENLQMCTNLKKALCNIKDLESK